VISKRTKFLGNILMLNSQMSVTTPKAQAYCKSLSRHFARKVPVDKLQQHASCVHFPMGECNIQAQGESLSFSCRADNSSALAKIQQIIDVHLQRQIDMKDYPLIWQSGE
jgi:hypothetical protein